MGPSTLNILFGGIKRYLYIGLRCSSGSFHKFVKSEAGSGLGSRKPEARGAQRLRETGMQANTARKERTGYLLFDSDVQESESKVGDIFLLYFSVKCCALFVKWQKTVFCDDHL